MITGLFGVVAVVLAIYFYFAGKREKEPVYEVSKTKLIENIADTVSKIELRYEGEIINDLTSTSIAVWNNGKAAVRREDIAPTAPIQITVVGDTVLLDVQVQKTTRLENNFTAKLSDDKSTITLSFDFLNHGEGAAIQVLHSGASYPLGLKITGTIIDFGPLKRYRSSEPRAKEQQLRIGALTSLSSAVLSIVAFVWIFAQMFHINVAYEHLKEYKSVKPLEDKMNHNFLIILLVETIILVGSALLRYTQRMPNSAKNLLPKYQD